MQTRAGAPGCILEAAEESSSKKVFQIGGIEGAGLASTGGIEATMNVRDPLLTFAAGRTTA